MAVLLFLLIVVAALVIFVYIAAREKDASAPEEVTSSPLVTVTVTRSFSERTGQDRSEVGEPQEMPDGSWVLNPKGAFPLTIVGATSEAISKVRSALHRWMTSSNWDALDELTGLFARYNLSCNELNAYRDEYGAKFASKIVELQQGHPEWASASALDRRDLMTEFETEALAALDLLPCESLAGDKETVLAIFAGDAPDPTIDDAIIERYGFEMASFYLRYVGDLSKVQHIPADSWNRKKFEALAQAGLARRGADIPIADILASLRLKELNMLATVPPPKPFTRKAAAIEYLACQPDTPKQLSNQVSLRELFQCVALPSEFSSVDFEAVAHHWQHSAAVAKVVTATFRAVIDNREERAANRDLGMHDVVGWEIHLDDDAPPFCKRIAAKALKAKGMPKLPAHIGCTCSAYPRFSGE